MSIKTLKKFETTHKAFLQDLPYQPLKKVLLKIFVLVFLGIILSLLSVIVTLIAFGTGRNTNTNTGLLVKLVAQNIPILLLTFLLFFKGNFSNVFNKLFPKIINKSVYTIFLIVLLLFAIGALFNFVNFVILYTPDKHNWLLNYVNHGSDKINPNYLIQLLGSLLIFIFISFSEEFVFRFTIYRFLRKYGIIIALIGSTILFSLIHGALVPNIILFGIIIALYYEYTNYFIGTVIIHTLHNFIIVYYSYYVAYLALKLIS